VPITELVDTFPHHAAAENRSVGHSPDLRKAAPGGGIRFYRLIVGVVLLLGAALAAGSAAGAKINALEKGGLAVLALLLTAVGGWLLTKQFKILK